MNPGLQWIASLALGLLTSLLLFWVMSLMIASGQLKFPDTEAHRMVEFVRIKQRHQTTPPTRQQPPKPPEKEPPPPKPSLATSNKLTPTPNLDIDIPALDIPLTGRLQGSLLGGIGVTSGGGAASNLIPLVRVPPQYPLRARQRRIQGWVKLEFTITREGNVKDIRVVESHPPKIFDQAAKRAIARWKFKPLVIDGEPVEQQALQVLEFKLKSR